MRKYILFLSQIYIAIIDVYGQDAILDHYERMVESLCKKSIGVSEVVGHLCKVTLCAYARLC